MGVDDHYWMQQAYAEALKAQALNEVPIGAVVVLNQQVIGRGFNCVIHRNDPCAHGELLALQAAAKTLNNYRLSQAILYSTLEPCAMCAGAMVHARISRLVFAARDFKVGAAGSVYNLLQGYPLNHQIVIDEGILEEECKRLLSDFFKKRRK